MFLAAPLERIQCCSAPPLFVTIEPGVKRPMLQVHSAKKLEAIESALRRAAIRLDGNVVAANHVSHIVPREGEDAFTFSVCQPDLEAGLLAADIRMSAFLPCRIAAYSKGGRVTLETVSPLEFCRLLNRADLAPLAAPLEAALLGIMNDAAAIAADAAHAAAGTRTGGLGATEDQVNMRGSIPQRIDRRGTKVEDLGGTGDHDAKGG